MLKEINDRFSISAQDEEPATKGELAVLKKKYGTIPKDYEELMLEAGSVDFYDNEASGEFLIWGPADPINGVIAMDEAYSLTKQIPGSFPFASSGGNAVFAYMKGNKGYGIYKATYGDYSVASAEWIAPSLKEILITGEALTEEFYY